MLGVTHRSVLGHGFCHRIALQGWPWGTRLCTICCPSALCRPLVSSSSNAFCNAWSLKGLRAAPPTGTAHCHLTCRFARIRCDIVGDPAVGRGPWKP